MTNKYYIKYMEFDLTNNCNLNCVRCAHCAPLVTKESELNYGLQTFKK